MLIFEQIEFLPIAYIMILMWVVFATVMSKLLGSYLIPVIPAPLQDLLSRRLNVAVSGDELAHHLFEQGLLANLNIQIAFTLLGDFARWIIVCVLGPLPAEALN